MLLTQISLFCDNNYFADSRVGQYYNIIVKLCTMINDAEVKFYSIIIIIMKMILSSIP